MTRPLLRRWPTPQQRGAELLPHGRVVGVLDFHLGPEQMAALLCKGAGRADERDEHASDETATDAARDAAMEIHAPSGDCTRGQGDATRTFAGDRGFQQSA